MSIPGKKRNQHLLEKFKIRVKKRFSSLHRSPDPLIQPETGEGFAGRDDLLWQVLRIDLYRFSIMKVPRLHNDNLPIQSHLDRLAGVSPRIGIESPG